MARILVVDDEENICFAFEQFLKSRGHEAFIASNGPDAINLVKTVKPQIAFLDICLPGANGLEVLEKIRSLDPGCAVIMVTAYGSMDTTIKAVQMGAYEYLTKPVDLGHVEVLINRILKQKKSDAAVESISAREGAPDEIIGQSPVMQGIFKMIGLLTTNEVTVLIEGESGVGKELVARAIHYKSERKHQPFVAVNCGAMPATLLESELFGYEKGAFTGADAKKIGKFEYAAGGTIFLDEIGDLELPLQIKLLRVLQERQIVRVGGLETLPVKARVITATNRNLYEEVNSGNFRSDLYYRLQLITLRVPPLRERRDDISLLTEYFIHKANRELGKNIKGIETGALDLLMAYSWPGNVRELENVIKRAVILARGNNIEKNALEFPEYSFVSPIAFSPEKIERDTMQWVKAAFKNHDFDDPGKLYNTVMNSVEKALIAETLERFQGNQVKTSFFLGINRTTLRKKMEEYGLK